MEAAEGQEIIGRRQFTAIVATFCLVGMQVVGQLYITIPLVYAHLSATGPHRRLPLALTLVSASMGGTAGLGQVIESALGWRAVFWLTAPLYGTTLLVTGSLTAIYTRIQFYGPAELISDPGALLALRASALLCAVVGNTFVLNIGGGAQFPLLFDHLADLALVTAGILVRAVVYLGVSARRRR